MDCSQTCCLADHRLNERGVNAALTAVFPGATRTASGAEAALAVGEVALPVAVFVLCFALSPVPAEDGAGHGTEPVEVAPLLDLNHVSGVLWLAASGWYASGVPGVPRSTLSL